MSEMNPITRLYNDTETILNSLTIKYVSKAEQYETMETRGKGDRYISALTGRDTFGMYDDYSEDEFMRAGIKDPELIEEYMHDYSKIPLNYRDNLLVYRRERETREYEELNEYYREITGRPPLDTTEKDFVYVAKEVCDKFNIPYDMPIHKIENELGDYYVGCLMAVGEYERVIKENPGKEYLKHIGPNRISIMDARTANNFAILHLNQADVMESTYREFIRSYEKARSYFIATSYTYEFRDVIPYYDNFIALCIFIMAIQQVSMRAIENAVQREFYDEYMVTLLYETYGVPYYSRVDKETQKLIVQNLNLLIQNKATNKVIIDIASLLGFNDISIFQYYLMKEQLFDSDGRPIIKKKKQINPNTGKEEEVYDYESMQQIYFQKADLFGTNLRKDLSNPNNRVEYNSVVYYDPYWWEDDELHKEIWEREYNYMETKYLGATIPYRMTDLLFQSVILLNMILDKREDYEMIEIYLPKINNLKLPLPDVVILFLALMSKKYKVPGQIFSTPSKIIHILETIGQEINKEDEPIEVLAFNFDAFTPERIEETKSILEPYFTRRKYRVVDGHDVDLNEDGTQNKSGPTKLVSYDLDTDDLDTFFKYLTALHADSGATSQQKIEALNNLYGNIKALYEFLTYQMSKTNDMEEYYAIKKFYDAVFFTNEMRGLFTIHDDEGEREATTFEEFFQYTNNDVYQFLQKVKDDEIYMYIDHIIYKMEEVVDDLGGLYLLNDGFSPLMQLLEILIKFFKSYRMDFINMSSLIIIDNEMDNTIRFFDSPHYIKKLNAVDDRFGTEFSDMIHKFMVKYSISDRIELSEYLRTFARIHADDGIKLEDLYEYMHICKVNSIKENIKFFDTISKTKVRIRRDDSLQFTDTLIKVSDIEQTKEGEFSDE